MENKRVMEIIRILLRQKDFITIQQVSDILQVSNKTIRNDLITAEQWFKEQDLLLVKKTGAGICIEGTQEQRLRVINMVEGQERLPEDYSPEARKVYIGLRLINSTGNCRIYELASELYVSRATIHKDILAFTKLAEKYHIQLIRKNNNGVSIQGKERKLRSLMFDLMCEDKGFKKFMAIVQDVKYDCTGEFIFEALDYTDKDFCQFSRLMIESGNRYINFLPFESLLYALLRTFIMMVRVNEGRYVALSESFIEELKEKPLYSETVQLLKILEQHYHCTFPEMEARYLQIYFVALQNQMEFSDKEQLEIERITDDLLRYWENIFKRSFTADASIREGLIAHLGPALTRFRHGIAIVNPMMHQIKTYYQNTFRIARESLQAVEEQYHCQLSDDEAGYIAIHLAGALERMKVPLNVVLVCQEGSGASGLLRRKLITQIPELRIVAQESFLSIQNADLQEADLILSTEELRLAADTPVVIIPALLSDEDIARLKDIIKGYYKAKNDPLPDQNVDGLPH